MIKFIRNLSTRQKLSYITTILVLIQFVRCNRNVPEFDREKDILVANATPTQISVLLRNACYDCHSYETKYPWYSQIAPLSWWITSHINEGREHLNFSTFMQYPAKKAIHKLEECVESIVKKEMPMNSYTWIHAEAKLNGEQKDMLVRYFQDKMKIFKEE